MKDRGKKKVTTAYIYSYAIHPLNLRVLSLEILFFIAEILLSNTLPMN